MSVSQYLERYAEPKAALNTEHFPVVENVVLIPAYNEPVEFLQRLQGFLASQPNALAIVVINQPNDESDRTKNQALAQAINALPLYKNDIPNLYRYNKAFIYCVDCFSDEGLPRKQGVGLARKIAGDIAVSLFSAKKLRSPWLHCTDADVVLPSDYFAPTAKLKATSAAAIYPFKHFVNEGAPLANVSLYEQRLHWYVAGLHWAKSPYAYHTIGSTLAINVEYYCKVRGFPKLAAGEDFHMLNKLAKTGSIVSLAQPVLALDGRVSLRVPFGTGRAVAELDINCDKAIFEAPEVFVALKTVLAAYPLFWRQTKVDTTLAIATFDADIIEALQYCGFPKMLSHAHRQATTFEQFEKQLNTAFDALQCRRFIGYLTRTCHALLKHDDMLKHPLTAKLTAYSKITFYT